MLKIENDLYKIIGVVGGISSLDLSHTAFLPLTTFADRIPEAKPPYQVNLRCVSWDDVEKVAAAIPRVVGRHQPIEQLRVEFPREALNNVKRVAWWIESFVYLAIASTLVLGGFGVWAVMMAAVRSRTREIGLKKAMGAEECDVLTQFITEALCLSLGAAILGIILGRLMVEGVSLWLGTRPSEGLFLRCLGLGLVFALLLGAGGGIYPSLRASRMEVVEATRYE
jgi:putative ABC transport system permease protein